MTTIRRSNERGHNNLGWLDSYHSFSFGHYYDPNHMGFRGLRVINEDRVQPAMGFGTHGHNDMEIISYVLEGKLQHKDSMGNGSVLSAGDVQRISAGRGITHSEFNGSDKELVHFLQIWIEPLSEGIEPSYGEHHLSRGDKLGKLALVASHSGRHGSISIHADADLYASVLEPGAEVKHDLNPDRYAWLQLIKGELEVDGTRISSGDALAFSDHPLINIKAVDESEFLLFDLA